MLRKTTAAALALCLCCLLSFGALADVWKKVNGETGYAAVIDDRAGLLQPGDEERNEGVILQLADYCNVGFFTCSGSADRSEEEKAEEWGRQQFGAEPFLVFMIDMGTRQVSLYSTVEINRIITTEVADAILDITYVYAGDGDFGRCALESYRLALKELEKQGAPGKTGGTDGNSSPEEVFGSLFGGGE